MSAGIGGINVDGGAAGALAGGVTNIVGSNGLSTSTAAGQMTIRNVELSVWRNFGDNYTNVNWNPVNTHASIAPFILPHPVAFSYVWFPLNVVRATAANTSSAYFDASVTAVFYSRNVSTLTYITSISNTMTSSWASNSAPNAIIPISMSNAAATTLTQGEYFVAFHFSTANSATNASTATTALSPSLFMIFATTNIASQQAAMIPFGSSVTFASLGIINGAGIISTAATRSSIAFTDYQGETTKGGAAVIAFALHNQTWQAFS